MDKQYGLILIFYDFMGEDWMEYGMAVYSRERELTDVKETILPCMDNHKFTDVKYNVIFQTKSVSCSIIFICNFNVL